jgi:hypothetical protein
MLEYTPRTEPIEKPGRLQLAILEWQRILVDKARMAHDAKGFIAAARRDT